MRLQEQGRQLQEQGRQLKEGQRQLHQGMVQMRRMLEKLIQGGPEVGSVSCVLLLASDLSLGTSEPDQGAIITMSMEQLIALPHSRNTDFNPPVREMP